MGTAEAKSPMLLQLQDVVLDRTERPVDQSRVQMPDITVRTTSCLAEVEAVWRELSVRGVQSPGQNFDFVRLWIVNRMIPVDDLHFVIAQLDNRPIALMPLQRQRRWGAIVYTWFLGSQVGGNAPLVDVERFAALSQSERQALWDAMIAQLKGADAAYLRAVPAQLAGHEGLFDGLGQHLAVDTLYRAEFDSWEACDRLQRSKSRRKHDRQQGEKLAALGAVEFEQITDLTEGAKAIDIMFAQRSARFKAQGIRDTFVCDGLTEFYHAALDPNSGIDVRLHVLRLDGEIVAVRYNIAHGDQLFCLISSMSDDAAIQSGSPGKQCLLRVMQSVFDEGFGVFDMGAGFTDEKRHWCNVQTELRLHYVPLTLRGQIIVLAHRSYQRLRAWAKTNKQLRNALHHLHTTFDGLRGRVVKGASE